MGKFAKIPVLALLLLLLLILGCQMKPQQLRPALVHEGEVYVYLEPLPQEAQRLSFTLNGVYCVRADGALMPLKLRTARFDAVLASRQRLVAQGVLPAGQYKGLAFSVKDAHLRTEEGISSSLLVPARPVSAGLPFAVKEKDGLVISMTLRYGRAVKAGFSFSPAFDLKVPDKPVDALLGYVVNSGSNDITVFNKSAMEVTGVIATGAGPMGMVLDPKVKRGYVALSREDAIDVIDMTEGAVVGRIRLNAGDDPSQVALTPDGGTLFSVNTGSNTISVIDPVSFVERSRIKVGVQPVYMLLDPSGKRAYVFNYFSNTVSIIDLTSTGVVATVATDTAPIRGAFNRAGDRLYIINESSPYLTVFDPSGLSIIKRQFAGQGMRAIKVDTRTDLVYIGKMNTPLLEVYDPFTFIPVDYIKAGSDPAYMTIDNDENDLCVVDPVLESLIFINLASKKTVSMIDVGVGPYWVTLMGER
ncbi:MAG: hypothetical protein M0033_06530 [Nitrospiraceae bacterium]|nr:hypothetical protein [Nitrospiraceae bacterium]